MSRWGEYPKGVGISRGGYSPPGHETRGEYPTPPSRHGTWDTHLPSPCDQRDACENITFPQLLLRTVLGKSIKVLIICCRIINIQNRDIV